MLRVGGVKEGGVRTGSGSSRWRRWLDGVTSSATRPPAWNRILSGLNLRIAVGHLERERKESTSEHGKGEKDGREGGRIAGKESEN